MVKGKDLCDLLRYKSKMYALVTGDFERTAPDRLLCLWVDMWVWGLHRFGMKRLFFAAAASFAHLSTLHLLTKISICHHLQCKKPGQMKYKFTSAQVFSCCPPNTGLLQYSLPLRKVLWGMTDVSASKCFTDSKKVQPLTFQDVLW